MAKPTSTGNRRSRLRLAAVIAAVAVGIVAALAGGAFADLVSNSLDTSADAVAETMPLTAGGAVGTTRLYIVPQNGDGKQGCNLTGSTTATISLSSSDTSVATVSPSSVTFTSCVDSTTGPVITVTPLAAGTTTISATLTGNTTAGSFDVAPVTFTVNVSAPTPQNTPPQVSVSGVTGGASYNKGSVPTAMCDVTDAEDGNSSFAATLSAITGPYASDGIGSQTASCSYTDGGGLTATDSVTYSIIDSSAPSIGYTLSPSTPDGANGWYKSDVTLTWTVTENESPNSLQKTGCDDQNITADQTEQTYSCSASSAGGSATQVDVKIKRDATAPTVSGAPTTTANSNGWYNSNVTIEWTCSDTTSLVASCPADSTISTEGRNQTANSGLVYDNAGNSNSADSSPAVNIDKTAPNAPTVSSPTSADYGTNWYKDSVTVSFAGNGDPDLADASAGSGVASVTGSQTFDSTNVNATTGYFTITGTATDNAANTSDGTTVSGYVDWQTPTASFSDCPLGDVVQNSSGTLHWSANDPAPSSGLSTDASGTVALQTGTVGSHTLTSPAPADNVGHTGTAASCQYNVVYNWTGFFQPVNNLTDVQPWNSAKSGSAIPVKFNLGGNQGTDIFKSGYPKITQMQCPNSSVVPDPIETYLTATAGGSTLTYDTTAMQYIYVWKTDKAWAGKCFLFQLGLNDNSTHNFQVQFTK